MTKEKTTTSEAGSRARWTAVEETVRKDIGQRIRQVRELAGITQLELSEILGTTQAKWSKYELGMNMPDPMSMIEFCAKFGVTLDYIYRGLVSSRCSREMVSRLGELEPGQSLKIPRRARRSPNTERG
ncbi:helix-turn-helix domain-containing protein [Acidocella aminolytica]|uniref:HTH cro/C1-type domain-containing protein n=1 Tax=Acidocella aminolytica 101 = DSM 11237 TaxID=1120923 RepID=A0A0D6PF31_9PROT|nr:helix-turn-helix transcriptional regulator [Acidocella aminolytica]GAN79813.1 hypothetical protein Aam_030_046 [Acidocella aminolytica 101 = DSM 11237]GBQ34335.1 hypothetical protein AA11237_0719 [Acidocella aminolytica 101 = DSM 11237]